jgi:hypothetical protein
VTAASVLLFVLGGLAILGALVLFALGSLAAIFTIVAILYLVVGALAIYAGVQCLGLKSSGQRLGIVLAAIIGILALISIGKSTAFSIVYIAMAAFIIWALYTNKEYFTA